MTRVTGVGKDAAQVSEPSESARELVEAIYNKIWGEMTFTEAAALIDAAIKARAEKAESEARALREALERIAEFQIWTGRNGAHNPDAVELQAMARSALGKGNKNGEA